MEYELRDFLIEPGHVEQFAREWADAVKPLREAAGFVIEAAWCLPDDDRFVWVFGWGGPGTLAEADAHYYQSPGRSRLDPDPARVVEIGRQRRRRDRIVDAVFPIDAPAAAAL